MRTADALVEQIIASSEIPSATQRRELARELRCHVEDFVLNARAAGHPDAEIEKLLAANFGDPLEIGRNFAWVYRRERALLRISVFAISTVAVAVAICAGILVSQAGLAACLGTPILKTLGSRHTAIESADILATVAFYVGILSLEKLFKPRRVPKAMAAVSIVWAVLLGCSALAGARTLYLVFGFANAIFLRVAQMLLKGRTARFGVVPLCFGLAGISLWAVLRYPGSPPAILASWWVMGLGYQLMTGLAARVDRGVRDRLAQL